MNIRLVRPTFGDRDPETFRSASSGKCRAGRFSAAPILLLALSMGLGAAQSPLYGAQRLWEKHFSLAPGGHVSVVNVHGSVMVEGWDRNEVEATVAMRSAAPTDQLNEVQVAVDVRDGGISFHTLYPGGLDTPIQVDYRLHVPRQTQLDGLSTLQGDIIVHAVDGTIEAHNLQGNIEGIDLNGSVAAHALTGNVFVSLRAMPDPGSPIQLATISGNIDLLIPSQANANLAMSTVAGKLLGGIPVQVSSTPGDSTRRAQIGAGGVHIELHTVRGNIRLSQRDENL